MGSFPESFGAGRSDRQPPASSRAASQLQPEGTPAGPKGCPLVDWTTRLPLPAGEHVSGYITCVSCIKLLHGLVDASSSKCIISYVSRIG